MLFTMKINTFMNFSSAVNTCWPDAFRKYAVSTSYPETISVSSYYNEVLTRILTLILSVLEQIDIGQTNKRLS